ncbi:HmuY family protein [Motilimonas pumila]|uniref:HmuY family protein n=1 Tax=Motilimonas pumila TaxID=2303987 RepID=UPI001313EA94|nr:HmuY family protein [Motilimonas pumila]
MTFKTPKAAIAVAITSLFLGACGGGSSSSDDSSGSTPTPEVTPTPVVTPTPEVTPAPSEQFSYLSLDATDASAPALAEFLSGSTVTDDTWQLGYQKYLGFMLNGGLSGSGAVSGCIAHQYTDLYDTDGNPVVATFSNLTKDTTQTDFNAVDATACNDFITDNLKTHIKTEEWLNADYSQGAPVYSAKAGNGWIVRTASGEAYARVSVNTVTVEFGQETKRQIQLMVENWDANAAAFSAAVTSPVLDFSTDVVYYDIESNQVVTGADDWDLSVKVSGREYPLQVNGGASGSGQAGVGTLMVSNISEVTDPKNTEQVYKYFADTAEGILSKPGSYGPFEYSVNGQHKMWPTFTTYLIKDQANGEERLFKVQVVSNYGEDGSLSSGNLVLRYQELN